MQPALPAPSAQGAFAKTPFPHLLVYALERTLSGSFELTLGGASAATLLVVQGLPAKLRTREGVHFLGDVMKDLGLVNEQQLAASIQRLQESPRLHGQVLIEMGVLDEQRVQVGVRAQLERKLEHMFTLPPDTVFSYFDGVDMLQRYGGPPTPLDPFPALWRGVRQSPPWEHVDGTLRRVGASALSIAPHARLERFQLGRVEAAAIDLLRQRPMRVVDLANAKVVGPSVAQLLVYTLVITKQVDLVETASMRPAQGQSPQVAVPPPPGDPLRQTGRNVPLGPPSGAAFARVQLQAKQVQRSPLVVEEVAPVVARTDGRIASPVPGSIPAMGQPQTAPEGAWVQHIPAAPPAPSFDRPPTAPADFAPAPPPSAPNVDLGAGGGLGLDIAAMISTTINSSMPPPMAGMPSAPQPPASASNLPAAPQPPASQANMQAASAGQISAAPPSSSQNVAAVAGAPLTAEQHALKQKILERAAGITAQNYFQMLGLETDATIEQVQKTFFGLAKVWHPDRLPAALIDVKDACSKVFAHLTEAHATLTDPKRRQEYMTLVKDGGATPDDQAKIQGILEAATEFQKAEFHLKRNEIEQAYAIAKRVHELDPDQADYLAMVTWIEAQKPQWSGREKTLEKIAVLDRCLKMNQNCERAYFWRGMLYKRIDESSKALKDFKRAAEINPRNLDAMREVRLHNIRGGSKAPPSGSTGGSGGSVRPGKPQPETLGGLFGKLFKK